MPGPLPEPGPPDSGDGKSTGPKQDVETNLEKIIDAEAQWQLPDYLEVDESQAIGLSINDSPEVRRAIELNLPGTKPSEGGPVTIGPMVSVLLKGPGGQIDIEPKTPQTWSTKTEAALLFTWTVTPKVVTDSLHLQVLGEVTMRDKSNVTTFTLNREIKVKRTLSYTLGEIFSHWATWAAIAAAFLAFFKQIRKFAGWSVRKTQNALSKSEAPQAKAPDDARS